MPNPWLKIPLADYEGHMDSPEVHQLEALSEMFAEALAYCRPASVAVLGIAGGNGLQHIDRTITRRVAGLDVNPLYLEEVHSRYGAALELELHCADLAHQRIVVDPAEMVHVALVFEHAGVELCLENALSLVAPGGALSAVLQRPTEIEQNVAASRFSSMQALKSHFALVDPEWLRQTLAERGFSLAHEVRRSLPAGKGFWMGLFRRQS